MKIVKESHGGQNVAEVTAGDLALINGLSRRELKAEEVYTFSVRLCDNEVDRDGERFSPAALEELAPLFVGKSGIFDHQWSARGQSARIYKTELVAEAGRTTRAGDGYRWLKGCAYMLRNEHTLPLIDEIEGGIKKEVSVGCSVKEKRCSVCGADRNREDCPHVKGEVYDGVLCYHSLEGAEDAYEFSFVAVPAQPAAGVVKGMEDDWKKLEVKSPGLAARLKQMEEEAQLGRRWRQELEQETVRLGLEQSALAAMVKGMPTGSLEQLKGAWGRQAGERYPLKPQLEYGPKTDRREEADGAFLI